MFTRDISELEYKDIEDLVSHRKQQEGQHLDYKANLNTNLDKAKDDLAKDLSAFANASGGYLILGVDNELNIIGISPIVQNKPIAEWINQIISTNTEPAIAYRDPKVISIPDSEKVIVVIQVLESVRKPHFSTPHHTYFIRINDSCKKANHYQIRDMFELTNNRVDAVKELLKERHLFDISETNFGLNNATSLLYNDIFDHHKKPKPILAFSVVPRRLDNKIDSSASALIQWLKENSAGFPPTPGLHLFNAHSGTDIRMDSVMMNAYKNYDELSSYFEVYNNGYLEAAASSSISFHFKNHETDVFTLSLSTIIEYEMRLMHFLKKFYDMIKYRDEVILHLSFANMKGLKLYGFHPNYNNSLTMYHHGSIKNKHHNNFTISSTILPNRLDVGTILEIAKCHSEKICRAFGLEKDYAFIEDNISLGHNRSFMS